MTEDRMLSDEILLGLINKNSGGGGGTTNYNNLENKPQIGGVTLIGNKTASDLGLASESDLANKQDVLTAGDYIAFDGNEISVDRIVPNQEATYQIVSDGSEDGTYFVRINKIVKGEIVLTERFSTRDNNYHYFDDVIRIDYAKTVGWNFTYYLMVSSTTHDAGYTYSWGFSGQVDASETVVIADHSGEKLIIKSEMDTALANKQDKTDNALQTTDKTIVGAINEHEDDVSKLKSGLTNLSEEVNGDATTYDYADVITIEDAVPANLADCSVKIEPVQDLHGYDKPWVGGAGKNKCDQKDTSSTNGILNLSINGTFGSVTEGQTYTFSFDVVEGNSNEVQLRLNNTAGSITSWYSGGLVVGQRASISFTASASGTINFWSNTGAFSGNNKVFDNIQLELGSTATDYAPYENICPISGHTEVDVQRDGKNLCDSANLGHYIRNNDTGEKITTLATAVSTTDIVGVKGNTTYVISRNSVMSTSIRVYYYDTNGDYISTEEANPFTTPINAGYIAFQNGNQNGDTTLWQIEEGSTATPYVPYAGKTYTIALGDTIYGGTVDFDSGVMTVDRKGVDMGTLTWVKANTSEGKYEFHSSSINDAKYTGASLTVNKCSCFKITTRNAVYSGQVVGLAFNSDLYKQICVYAPMYADASEFTTAMTGQKLCYELATPTTIQLTPQQIQLLKGVNTISASTGKISVTVNGVSGSIGAVQEQVNELAEDVAEIKPVNYSTTEQKTGQKWIDGKDVYVKTIEFGALPSSTQKDVSSGLSGVNIIKMEAVATSNDDTLLIPYNAANNFVSLLYIYSTNSVRIWSSTDLSNHNAVVILYYTKTT